MPDMPYVEVSENGCSFTAGPAEAPGRGCDEGGVWAWERSHSGQKILKSLSFEVKASYLVERNCSIIHWTEVLIYCVFFHPLLVVGGQCSAIWNRNPRSSGCVYYTHPKSQWRRAADCPCESETHPSLYFVFYIFFTVVILLPLCTF